MKQTDGTLTVWVDSARLAAAKLYQKQHPAVKMDIVTYDGDANGSNYLRTKVSLFNRTRKGWPDVVFSSQNNETSWAVRRGLHRPAEQGTDPQVHPREVGEGSQRPLHGGRHALLPAQRPGPDRALVQRARCMKKWGYTVPATWEQYQALGQKVATEHPGYLVGSAGDSFAPEIYMWASKCGANHDHRAQGGHGQHRPARTAPGWPRCWTP